MITLASNLASQIKKSLFVDQCFYCNDFGNLICKKCLQKLRLINHPLCLKCGTPYSSGISHMCSDCTTQDKAYDMHRSLFVFDENSQQLIHALKYKNEFWVRQFLKTQWQDLISQFTSIYCIIPIPLTQKKLRQRGFNQSQILASFVAKDLNVLLQKDVLLRQKQSLSQTSLKRAQRLINLKDAFFVQNAKKIEGKNVLLMDDVYTTGATIQTASDILKKSGAKRVFVFTILKVLL